MRLSIQRRPQRSEGGFTLIELMVVIAIIGILLTIVIPSIRAIQKARLGKTEVDIRTVGLAWCERFEGVYANCGPGVPQPTDVSVGDFPQVLDDTQREQLEDILGVVMPKYDAWREEIEYRVDNWPNATRFMIRSQNGNRAWDDTTPYLWQIIFPSTDRETDIVWVNCHWVQAWC